MVSFSLGVTGGLVLSYWMVPQPGRVDRRPTIVRTAEAEILPLPQVPQVEGSKWERKGKGLIQVLFNQTMGPAALMAEDLQVIRSRFLQPYSKLTIETEVGDRLSILNHLAYASANSEVPESLSKNLSQFYSNVAASPTEFLVIKNLASTGLSALPKEDHKLKHAQFKIKSADAAKPLSAL